MNILNKIAERRYEEATHLVGDLVRNGKLLYDAVAEVEQYMCNRYGKNWRTNAAELLQQTTTQKKIIYSTYKRLYRTS